MAQSSLALLLALTQAFHAASTDEPTSQENAREHPLAAEVHQILSRRQSYISTVSELTSLGPPALPAILEEVPRLRVGQLGAAAIVLCRAGYRPAVPALVQRLREGPVSLPVLRALGWIPGATEAVGAAEVASVAELANDSNGKGRLHAFATLASIGTPEAVAAIEAILGPLSREWRVAFVPPEPRTDAPVARVPLAEGHTLVVFQSLKLGSRSDLWAVELNAAGAVAVPARFLGVSPGCSWCPISARLDGSKLTVFSSETRRTVSVDPEVAARDSDADGLPDLVERRLGTDPRKPDTDGDGIDDGDDPIPNVPSRPPQGEREEIVEALFQQVSLLDDDSSGLEAVISEAPLRWYGRKGPTLAFSSHDAAERYAKRSGASNLLRIWFKLVSANDLVSFLADDPAVRPPGRDERAYVVGHYVGGPLGSSAFRVIVRRLNGRWVIRDVFGSFAS